MTLFVFLVWLQMSAQPAPHCIDRPAACGNIERVCDNAPSTVTLAECASPALIEELNQAAQRAADETDGKPPPCKMDDGTPCEYKAVVIPPGASMLPVTWPEPVDVPAVQVKTHILVNQQCPLHENLVADRKSPSGFGCEHITCADKSRVLLTSEDGKKHCVKF